MTNKRGMQTLSLGIETMTLGRGERSLLGAYLSQDQFICRPHWHGKRIVISPYQTKTVASHTDATKLKRITA